MNDISQFVISSNSQLTNNRDITLGSSCHVDNINSQFDLATCHREIAINVVFTSCVLKHIRMTHVSIISFPIHMQRTIAI